MSKIRSKIKTAQKVVNVTENYFKTYIAAQTASAGPPLGPLLGKYGINISNFCKDFNETTKHFKKGVPLPVVVRINPNRTYNLEISKPSSKYYLLQAAGIEYQKYPDETTPAGKVTIKHIYEIAKIKQEDPYSPLQLLDLQRIVKQIVGTAHLLGIQVVREIDPEEYKQFLLERNNLLGERQKKIEEEIKARLNRIQTT